MRRPHALSLTLGTLAIPATAVVGAKGLGNPMRKKRHFAGLGDGNIDTIHQMQQQQGLRGAATKRKRVPGVVRSDAAAGGHWERDRVAGAQRERERERDRVAGGGGGIGGDDQAASDELDDAAPIPFRREYVKDAPGNDYPRAADGRMDALDDYLRRATADRRTAYHPDPNNLRGDEGGAGAGAAGGATNNQAVASDGPWQLSIVMLLGIVGVLLGLFVHFSTDPSNQPSYLRRRRKKSEDFHSPSYRKKTDAQTDDWGGEMTEDDNYRGDTEVGGGASIAKKRSPLPKAPDDPTARLYYQLNTSDNFRRQELSLRKSIQTQQSSNLVGGESSTTVPVFHSPSRPSRTSTPSASGNHRQTPQHGGRIETKMSSCASSSIPSPPFPAVDKSGIGSGLEGFSAEGFGAPHAGSSVSNELVIGTGTPKPLVKPMGTFTLTESFASITVLSGGKSSVATDASSEAPSSSRTPRSGGAGIANNSVVGAINFNTPPASFEEESKSNHFPSTTTATTATSSSSPQPSPRPSPRPSSGDYFNHFSAGLSELPTPRVDHTRGKRDVAREFKERAKHIPVPLSCASTEGKEEVGSGGGSSAAHAEDAIVPKKLDSGSEDASSSSALHNRDASFPGLPLVPNLNASGESYHIDAPRSLALEELQLVRMESGVSGPRWRTKYELDKTADSTADAGTTTSASTTGTEEQLRQQQTENMEKLREASVAVDPADDPRGSIQHIRTDLTISSDASSSLSSKITFSELKLEDVIGGGGFGQVWRARWKGTPVAVKVLTGSAQAETVPKAVLEEFIAEINMVSGMRHPNICLFMGACLEPPNRAIVTELCENGSLWDALRSPLTAYHVADGMTRVAWPLNLYDSMTTPPPTFEGGQFVPRSCLEPPMPPGGAWPWVLVKRVAAGTARGMCYLHSGNPPVLHRDLKSANILLDESYTAKLADFGLSRLKAVRSGMTGNCGTVQWMAPEVLCNEHYAEPADVFSFGIILWEMLSKECPYDGMTPIQCALSVLNENKRPAIPDWCPQPLRALIKNCVERDPLSRPTFTQILAALDAMP